MKSRKEQDKKYREKHREQIRKRGREYARKKKIDKYLEGIKPS